MATKRGSNNMTFISMFENWLYDFSVIQRAGSYPADINRFQSHSVKNVPVQNQDRIC